ncbi:MAG: molybdenum cofactor guanylyltransferase [Deltaproteobacteria bacterium]|nr:molybdenum cofactor guanylyltransferase [Deltaproteobacteria bacterium]
MVRSDVTALILAGGRATRLGGIDKSALLVDGLSIFDRQCNVLLPRVADIIVSAQAAIPGHKTVADRIAGAGPLAGIAAGVAESRTVWLLVLAGDMPYISGALLDRLLAAATNDVDAVGIRIGGMPEPLVCVLRTAAVRPHLDRRLAQKQLKASALLTDDGLRVAWIEESELREIDPELRALFNVNEPDDLPDR